MEVKRIYQHTETLNWYAIVRLPDGTLVEFKTGKAQPTAATALAIAQTYWTAVQARATEEAALHYVLYTWPLFTTSGHDLATVTCKQLRNAIAAMPAVWDRDVRDFIVLPIRLKLMGRLMIRQLHTPLMDMTVRALGVLLSQAIATYPSFTDLPVTSVLEVELVYGVSEVVSSGN